ncbi:hypothetical protein OR604_18200 [Aeromonas caviae]|uniref:hypothetical protein n=1 Tax=Aeromonas caviae TaxID=648 RepID=UPI00225C28BA|nr:hypothetical protein [Aeromonas caviae]MCX4038118.1 hypothetical protein [Aeromonas caviae]
MHQIHTAGDQLASARETLGYCAEARYAAVKLGEELEEKITTKAKNNVDYAALQA